MVSVLGHASGAVSSRRLLGEIQPSSTCTLEMSLQYNVGNKEAQLTHTLLSIPDDGVLSSPTALSG